MSSAPGSSRPRRGGCITAIIGLAVIGILISKARPPAASAPVSAVDKAEEEVARRDASTLYAAKAAIKNSLKDPSSAEFGDSFARLKHGQRVACGEINAKNSFGAMAGMNRWVVLPDQQVLMIRSFDNASRFAQIWNRYCAGVAEPEKPAPTEFVGVKIGGRPPVTLQPFEGSPNVRVFKHQEGHAFLGVPITEPTFIVEDGRIVEGDGFAKGRASFTRLKSAIFAAFGTPASDTSGDDPIVQWDWGKGSTLILLSYSTIHDQTTVKVVRNEGS